jgi:hypothetical protein
MKAPAHLPTNPRHARLERWARLWLARLGAYLATNFAFLPPLPRAIERECQRGLDRLALLLGWMLVHRACMALEHTRVRVHERRRGPHANAARRSRPHAPLRTLLGAKLRRGLHQGGIGARIHFMYRMLADMAGFAAELAVRLRDGLTRLLPILAFGAPAPPPAFFADAVMLDGRVAPALDTS